MRIDLNHRLHDANEVGNESSNTRAAAAAPAKAGRGEDTAELSIDQVRVQSLARQVHELPEVRQEKVTALGQAIQQGRYDVTPEQTAEAMLHEMVGTAA